MRWSPGLFCLIAILHCSYAPPVTQDKDDNKDSEVKDDLEEYMEYHRYLREVVQTLENDPEFRERLEKANEEDIRSGKIAEQLDFVSHNVRSKLDEIKRRELERLRHLATKQYELNNHLDSGPGAIPSHDHLDHTNTDTFEIQDLMKLISKTTSDLEKADKQRKEQFKEYEMQKEFEKNQKLEHMDEEHKKQYLETIKAEEEAKKHHQPIHHPGSKQQLEEVWEKTDHQDQQFDPKAFFMMHDVDGNGVWDADEVKALFIKELDKIYGPGGPNKDLHERAEEMERMREHVFQENDKNRDGLIDFQEFMLETQRENFKKDEGWKTLDDENQVYSQSEYDEFQRRRLNEFTYLQQRGLVDANFQPIPGAEHQIHEAMKEYYKIKNHNEFPHGYPQGHYPSGQHPPQGQYPPGQHPQQVQYNQHGYQQVPPQHFQQPQGQAYQQPGQYQQPNQAQFQAGQNLNQQHHAPQSGQPQVQSQPQLQSPQTQSHQTFQNQPPVNQGQQQPNQAQFQQNQGQFQQNQGQVQPNQGQVQQNQGQVQQNQGQFQQNQGQVQQNQGQFQQNQGQFQQNQGQVQQNQGQVQQNQGQAQQNQGQVQQNQGQQINQGQVPNQGPQQLNQGQVQSGQPQQNQVNQGQAQKSPGQNNN